MLREQRGADLCDDFRGEGEKRSAENNSRTTLQSTLEVEGSRTTQSEDAEWKCCEKSGDYEYNPQWSK